MKETKDPETIGFVDLILKWPFLVSVLILVINDGFLKSNYPGFITGKLSDFAGLFFAPILLLSILEFFEKKVFRRLEVSSSLIFFAYLLIGLVFSLAQTTSIGAEIYLAIFALGKLVPSWGNSVQIQQDWTDLIANIFLLGSFFWSSSLLGRFNIRDLIIRRS